jgi:hypothetical protein
VFLCQRKRRYGWTHRERSLTRIFKVFLRRKGNDMNNEIILTVTLPMSKAASAREFLTAMMTPKMEEGKITGPPPTILAAKSDGDSNDVYYVNEISFRYGEMKRDWPDTFIVAVRATTLRRCVS